MEKKFDFTLLPQDKKDSFNEELIDILKIHELRTPEIREAAIELEQRYSVTIH